MTFPGEKYKGILEDYRGRHRTTSVFDGRGFVIASVKSFFTKHRYYNKQTTHGSHWTSALSLKGFKTFAKVYQLTILGGNTANVAGTICVANCKGCQPLNNLAALPVFHTVMPTRLA